MQEPLNCRHRVITDEDIVFIRKLIAEHPERLCAAWNWVQANGAPRDMVCRGLMLKLQPGAPRPTTSACAAAAR